MVTLLTDIRYRIKAGGDIYRKGDTFKLPVKAADAEIAAGRVAEVADVADKGE